MVNFEKTTKTECNKFEFTYVDDTFQHILEFSNVSDFIFSQLLWITLIALIGFVLLLV
jgi:hypothetical protein